MLHIVLLSVAVWLATCLGLVLVGFWVIEVLLLREGPDRGSIHGQDDIQVRIVTVDAETIVQQTVDSLPDRFNDIHVIAEDDIQVSGANVHQVPESFSCNAVRKGRALEWARRTLQTDREYVLYLDEDSKMPEFSGLPDKDLVQLREQPQPTGSLTAFVADVYRMGLQLEQLAFSRLQIPLFVWGGGLAVRSSVEEDITWNRPSLVEDTAFAWKAGMAGYSLAISDIFVRNQAPPGIHALLQQRRRWSAGNHRESGTLPQPYRTATRFRNYAWGVTPLAVLLGPVVTTFLPLDLVAEPYLTFIGSVLLLTIPFWYLMGVLYYPEKQWQHLAGIPLLPVGALLHGIGALWGIISPPSTFSVTPKVADDRTG